MSDLRTRTSSRTLTLVQLAVLSSIIILLGFTPIGFLKVGIISITFIVIPVAIGAIMLGPTAGAVLGAVFGAVSFAQCFGFDSFGVFLLGIDPVKTFIMCFFPRVLVGFLTGLTYRLLSKIIKSGSKTVASIAASLVCPLSNTLLFMGTLILLFGGNADVLSAFGVNAAWAIFTVIWLNAAVEAAVTLVVSAAVSRALIHVMDRYR